MGDFAGAPEKHQPDGVRVYGDSVGREFFNGALFNYLQRIPGNNLEVIFRRKEVTPVTFSVFFYLN
jgi:hypothetical protein